MERMKRWLSLALALVLVLSYVPANVFAAEAGEDPAPVETTTAVETTAVETTAAAEEEVVVTRSAQTSVELPANEELFTGYAEGVLYGMGGVSMFSIGDRSAGAKLTGDEKLVYDALVPFIKDIAAGNRASTVVRLGYSGSYDSDKHVSFTGTSADFDLDAIMDALLMDYPYEMYWLDQLKSGGMSAITSYPDDILKWMEIKMPVAVTFAAGDYTADTAKTGAVTSAATKAAAIVAKYASASDYDKLVGYRNEICALVSYDDTAASGGDSYYKNTDSNPWQLIYVFDGNTATNVVCEGYSKAFQYLCDLSGVPCICVRGTMTAPNGVGGHMWNVVTLEGKNYLVDVTNSDDDTLGQDGELFLAGAAGSPASGYSFTAGGKTVSYAYGYDTPQIWTTEELTLASKSYNSTDVTVCFVPNTNWKEENAWFAAYYWDGNGSDGFVKLEADGFCYTGEIPEGYNNIIFIRKKPSDTTLSWNNVWAQTGDLTLDASKSCFVQNAGGVNTGTWTTCPPAYDYYLAGYLNNANVGIKGAANASANKFANGKVTVTFTADSYVCLGVQYGTSVIGNYMAQSYVSSGSTAAMYTTGGEKLLVPAGKYTFTLVENADGSVTLSYAHAHTMTYHAEVGATCAASGNVAYYACSGCGKNFSDEAGTTVLSDEDLIIPSGAHNYDDNGFCATETDGSVCDAYEPAVKVTEDNYTELGLTDAYIGYYAISNAGNLYWFADKVDNENTAYSAANVVLTKDITVNTGTMDANTTGARVWTPIGDYEGVIDGNGCSISGLYCNDEDSDRSIGLLSALMEGGVVKNLTVSNSYFHGENSVGGIAGHNMGTISGCSNNATIESVNGTKVGGVAGSNYGTVTDCINNGTISGYSDIGGIVGYNVGVVELCGNTGSVRATWYNAGGMAGTNTTILRNCWNTGKVNAYRNYAGGIVGYNGAAKGTDPVSELENCWSTGTVTCDEKNTAGGIVGRSWNGDNINCYSVMKPIAELAAGATESKMEVKTLEQFASGEVAYLLQGEQTAQIWGQSIDNDEPGQTVPVLNGAKVYEVLTDCQGSVGYSNTESGGTPAHSYDEKGFCTNKADYVVCDAYEPAVKVTEDNYTELGLTDAYIGYYAIQNAGNLYWFADKVDNENAAYRYANAVLTADIMIPSKPTGTRYWNPIGSADAKYSGIFDGNGKAIGDIFAGDTTADMVGLVAWLTEDGVVKNVTVTGVRLNGNDTVGAIVAYNEGTVELCGNTASVIGEGISIGGIVGVNAGTVRNCWNTGRISGEDAGGIVGNNEPGATVANCWSTGEPEGTNAGGIVGFHQTGATAENCYTTQETAIATAEGTVSKAETKTADQFASGEVAYLLGGVWGQNIDNGETPQTVPALNSATVYQVAVDCQGNMGYSNTDSTETPAHNYVNGFCVNETNGVVCDDYQPATLVTEDNYTELDLTADYVGYYAISNAGNLYWFADKVDTENDTYGSAKVVLAADITVNEGEITASSTDVRVWNPIGDKTNIFNGTFDGNGKTVSGLYYNNSENNYVGLFARVSERGVVKNVTVTKSYFCGYYHVAGIVGLNEGTVTDCVNRAMMDCDGYSGGIVGNNQGNISNCLNYGTIHGSGNQGGIAGYNSGCVELCGNEGSISTGWMHAGGIVGDNTGTVRNCWNTGDVYAKKNCAGGIAGSNMKYSGNTVPVVENCWSTGSVTPVEQPAVGGIVGRSQDSSQNNCYSVMKPVGQIEDENGVSTVENMEAKTLEQFASGEVAYLLGGVWGQDLDNGKTVQTVPSFDGADVYYGYFNCGSTEAAYTNTTVSAEPMEHDYENGFCELVAGESHYEPATLVDGDNYTELGLSADYVGYYAISNAGQLYWFSDKVDNENATYGSVNVVLTADVTVNEGTVTASSTGMRDWNPIGWFTNTPDDQAAFSGTFDGNGKSISGLYFNNVAMDGVSLFAITGETALVKNVTVTNSYFCGNYNNSAVVAINYGTVSSCFNEATLIGYAQIGGIVGRNLGLVELCGNTGAITGEKGYVGGIVGDNKSTVRNCWNTGNIQADLNYVGGITGANNSSGTDGTAALTENCWSTGTVVSFGRTSAGGIVGAAWVNLGGVRNCYSLMKPVGLIRDAHPVTNAEQKTLDQFASGEVAYLLRTRAAEGTDVWGQNIDNGQTVQTVPALNGADVYQIPVDCMGTLGYSNTNITEVPDHSYDDNGFCANTNNGVVCDAYEPATLVTAENCAELGLSDAYIGYYAITNAGNLYWFADKVDNDNANFGAVNVVLTDNITVNTGTMDANTTGARVWNPIGWYNSSSDNVAFSGIFDGNGKTVSGLYYNNSADTSNYIGLVACVAEGGTVKHVTLSDSYILGYQFVGGIAGINYGTVTGCVNNAAIGGDGCQGGIAGENHGTVELCGNTGTITNTWCYSGGIVGRSYGIIRNCWNTGSFRGDTTYAGGIVGTQFVMPDLDSLTENCWSMGQMADMRCGGIAGWLNGPVTVRNCYSDEGTLVGETSNNAGSPTMTNVQYKSTAAFASGEVAYLLGGVWGQDLDNGKPVQTIPTFDGAPVYYGYTSCADTQRKYTNNADASDTPVSHDWGYTATGAQIIGTCVNGCGADGGKVALTLDGSAVYDGTEKTVKYDGSLKGIDTLPAVTYEGNRINTGTFTAYLTLEDGTKAQLEVTITAKEITPTIEGVRSTYSYNGEAIKPAVTVKDGDKVLTEGTDYEVTYGENLTTETDGYVKVTLKGNYEGEAQQDFTIAPKIITPTVEGVEDGYTYTGEAIQPAVTVKDGDKVLTAGTDYDVTYGENKNVGEGTVTVTLKGNYSGSAEETFTITAKAITPVVEGVEDSYSYTGEAIQPTVTVKDGDKVLIAGTDYDVAYGENKNVGEGTVTVTLKGNYEGEAEKSFTITAKTLTIAGMTGTDKVYDGTTAANVELLVDGIVTADDVEVSFEAAYESANAGTHRIHATDIKLSGDEASNYVIANETTGSGEIARATVTVTSVTVADKTYDGTTDAEVTEVLSNGIVSGDDVTVTAAGAFVSAASGENKTVTVTVELIGEGKENYVLTQTVLTTTASILPVDVEDVMEPLDGVTTDNVTSDDLDKIDDVREDLEDALEDPGLSDQQKEVIQDALDELDELEKAVEDAHKAVEDESVDNTQDVTGENVTKDDREELEEAKDVLEDALENFGDNYTEEEKETIQEELDRIQDALDVLDKIEDLEDVIEALPEAVQPDDEETVAAIEDAKKTYDELTDHEKELVSDEAVEKLDGLLTALTYEIVKGNGLTWAKGTGARPEFTANGPYSKFVGILVDGKEVAQSNYEARQGSTVITLKTAYIEGLTRGKHTITVLYTNGQADGYFYITVMADAPATGDTANVALWSSIALISLLAAAALVLGKKRFTV